MKNQNPAAGKSGEVSVVVRTPSAAPPNLPQPTQSTDARPAGVTRRRPGRLPFARVKFWEDRLRHKSRGPRASIVAIRIAELMRIFNERYGSVLPDDDAGREDAAIMAHHIGRTRRGADAVREWLRRCAPWMSAGDVDKLVTRAMTNPRRWRADVLAKRLGLRLADRARLHVTTIGATDQNRNQRRQARLDRQRIASRIRRRGQGASDRDKALSRQKPWAVEGISRATWWRRRRP